jgi:hypothetical protein
MKKTMGERVIGCIEEFAAAYPGGLTATAVADLMGFENDMVVKGTLDKLSREQKISRLVVKGEVCYTAASNEETQATTPQAAAVDVVKQTIAEASLCSKSQPGDTRESISAALEDLKTRLEQEAPAIDNLEFKINVLRDLAGFKGFMPELGSFFSALADDFEGMKL